MPTSDLHCVGVPRPFSWGYAGPP